jgi:hypothetical protein
MQRDRFQKFRARFTRKTGFHFFASRAPGAGCSSSSIERRIAGGLRFNDRSKIIP